MAQMDLGILSEDCIALGDALARKCDEDGHPVLALTLRQIAWRYRLLLNKLYGIKTVPDVPPQLEAQIIISSTTPVAEISSPHRTRGRLSPAPHNMAKAAVGMEQRQNRFLAFHHAPATGAEMRMTPESVRDEIARLRRENERLTRSQPRAAFWLSMPLENGRMVVVGLPDRLLSADDYEMLMQYLVLMRPALVAHPPQEPTP